MLFLSMFTDYDKTIGKIAEGDKEALALIYRAYGKLIYSVGYNIVKNSADAEDILQETMLRILKCANTYRRGTNPKAWVLAIARNCAIDMLNSRKFHIPLDEAVTLASDDVSALDEMLLIEDAMRQLSFEERTVINLRLNIGLSHKEIASVLGINVFAAQKKYQRALKNLQTILLNQEELANEI